MTMTPVETSKGCEDSKERTIVRYQTLIICIGRCGRTYVVHPCVTTYLRSPSTTLLAAFGASELNTRVGFNHSLCTSHTHALMAVARRTTIAYK